MTPKAQTRAQFNFLTRINRADCTLSFEQAAQIITEHINTMPPQNTAPSAQLKHTPTPWTHTPGQDTIWAKDGDLLVARMEYTRGDMAVNEDEANAAMIARAVNSHAGLVAALTNLLKMTEDGDVTTAELDAARLALRNAEAAQ